MLLSYQHASVTYRIAGSLWGKMRIENVMYAYIIVTIYSNVKHKASVRMTKLKVQHL